MFFSRSLLSLFLAISAFVLFSSATPIAELVVRSPEATAMALPLTSEIVARTSKNSCSTPGCNEQAILSILLDLQAAIDVKVGLLDGKVNPGPIIADICLSIQVAVTALLKVQASISIAGSLIVDILKIVIHIVLCIAQGISKYGLLVLLAISVKIDLALAGLFNVLCGLLPYLQGLLAASLKLNLNLLVSVKFVLTIAAVGLRL